MPAPAVAGEWELRVDFLHGARTHRLALEQQGARASPATRSSAQFEGPVSGALEADLIRFTFGGRYEASRSVLPLRGPGRDGTMAGSVALGAASDQNAGIVNRSQFGTGEWQARRVA